jgi:DivIVA domain-containing protein
MALTPEDVENKQFIRVLRGYDPAEVAAFLRVVAAELRKHQVAVEAVAGEDGDPLADDVVVLLRTAYETAQARSTRPARPRAGGRARTHAAATPSPARRQRPLRAAP